jgi:hypothetical protein
MSNKKQNEKMLQFCVWQTSSKRGCKSFYKTQIQNSSETKSKKAALRGTRKKNKKNRQTNGTHLQPFPPLPNRPLQVVPELNSILPIHPHLLLARLITRPSPPLLSLRRMMRIMNIPTLRQPCLGFIQRPVDLGLCLQLQRCDRTLKICCRRFRCLVR